MKEYPIGISGILRCKNCDDYLEACIDSVIDALDELVAVYHECTDRTVAILEQKRQQYPDKVKLYEYLPHVLPMELDKETFAYAKELPDGAEQLFSGYSNYALSKASFRYIMKVDADQIYFTERLKRICDAYRSTDKATLTEKEKAAFQAYSKRSLTTEQWGDYESYIEKRIINDKVATSFSGINLYHQAGQWMVGLGDRQCHSLPPLFNGAHDHFFFDASKRLRYENRITPSLLTDGYGRIVELMRYEEEMLDGGFLWFHLKALTKGKWNEPIPTNRIAPLQRLIDLPYNRFKAQYRPYFRTRFMESGSTCLFEVQKKEIPWSLLGALEEQASKESIERKKRTLCFIPVRKGSKGIPGKNLKVLGGKPLVCWILDTVLDAEVADEVWIATDCDEMERLVCTRYAEQVRIYRRSERSARDEAPTMVVVREFLEEVNPDDDDRFILLQTTSPFTRKEELKALKEEMEKGKYDSYISCCRQKKFRWDKDGQPLDYTFARKPRRQDYEGMLLESGAFYASTVRQIKQSDSLVSGNIRVMETDASGMIDIDDHEDWMQAEHQAESIGTSYDYHVEFYETLDELIEEYTFCKQLEQPIGTYLFLQAFHLREAYNGWRKSGIDRDECRERLAGKVFPNTPIYMAVQERFLTDYRTEPWSEFLSSLQGNLLVYVYNNRQLNYLLPLVNRLNRPILLLCESCVDEEVEVNDNVTAIEMPFTDDNLPELQRYYVSFHAVLEALQPEGVLVLEGCHYQEQILAIVAQKLGITDIGLQQGWPSFMHTMFRRFSYSYYLTWGNGLNGHWHKYNPDTRFISTGYLYEVQRKCGTAITFFLQSPRFLSDDNYFRQLVSLIEETAERYPNKEIGVREHPEYRLDTTTVEKLQRHGNVRFMSDLPLSETFARTQVVVSHFSSALMEGMAHDCIPLVFDPTQHSRYTPDVEALGVGCVASDKLSFFKDLAYIEQHIAAFIEKIITEKSDWFQELSESAIKRTIDAIHRIAPSRYLQTTDAPKLHIGCGPFVMEGWLNVDINCHRPDIRYMDAGKPYPFPDYSFDYIYSEHLFEHLSVEEQTVMLQECYRILKPGGRMRLAMPNLHFLMELYLHPDKDCNRRYLAWSYRLFGMKQGIPEVAEKDYPIHVINNFFRLWGHQFIHTPESLKSIAQGIGFQDIRPYPIGNSDTPALQGLEKHGQNIPAWANELETFVVEMIKAEQATPTEEETDGPKISVIVPVYNGEKYIEACLENVIAQSLDGWEMILVNDGSTDASRQIMKKYAESYNHFIIYVEQENRGLSEARNTGLQHAHGKYIAFLDGDDLLPKDALLSFYRKAKETCADMVAGNVVTFGEGIASSDFSQRNQETAFTVSGETFLTEAVTNHHYVPMVYNYLYRRSFIEQYELRFEPGILHEDELWTPIALTKAKWVASISNTTYLYRQHGASIMSASKAERRIVSLEVVVRKLEEFMESDAMADNTQEAISHRIGILKQITNHLKTNSNDR